VGEITGFYADATFAIHGFVRAVNGVLTTFDVPGSGAIPSSINPTGEITGNYLFELGNSGFFVPRGFLRARDGTITVNIDPANTFTRSPGAINPDGTIAGPYQDDITGSWHCFLRNKHGVFTTFDIPGARIIFSATLNQGGAVVGTFQDTSAVFHGFVRTAQGTLTTIDAPDAGTSFFQGTFVSSINTNGTITGHYTDASFTGHGFVGKK
jgi:hypothetical protein